MKKYVANRLSGGNRIFPSEIKLDDFGVTVKVPGLFSGEEKSLSFDKISSVRIECPLVGFSKIIFDTIGWDRISIDGFEKKDVEEIKELVQLGIRSIRSGGGGNSGGGVSEHIQQHELEKTRVSLEKQKHEDEMELKNKQQKLEEQKNRQKRSDELRQQGKHKQAFLVEHG